MFEGREKYAPTWGNERGEVMREVRENCPNMEFFLVCISLYLDWIQENAEQKKFRIWTIFT